MSFRDHPARFHAWLQEVMRKPDPHGGIPSNQPKKGSALLCCGDIAPVRLSRDGQATNAAQAANSAAPRNPTEGIGNNATADPKTIGDAQPYNIGPTVHIYLSEENVDTYFCDADPGSAVEATGRGQLS